MSLSDVLLGLNVSGEKKTVLLMSEKYQIFNNCTVIKMLVSH